MKPPPGYVAYEHDDGTVHAIDIFDGGLPVWRTTPVCGAATGVSSDADGAAQMAGATTRPVTCRDCLGIIG